ncbi:MAG TPA: type II toxin-antitoxin system MqsR family toxin [Longimicrobium sp.]|nr:type II toxin-antitoxin system MqsR family toxin [Longimicrobium sp.]
MPGTPTYDLELIQRCVGQGALTSSIMAVAAAGASELGWTLEHIIEAVLLLSSGDFYKTMESERVPGLWQDVYHLQYRKVHLYIKVQMGQNGRAYVVQFKRK